MRPTDPHERPEPTALDRREFLRLGGTLAAASALATTGCQPPQEATIPFHDMPESLADGLGRARFYRTVLAGSPVQVTTREGRPILVAPPPDDRSGRGVALRHQAAIMDLYDPDRARHPLAVRRGQGAPVPASWAAIETEAIDRLRRAGSRAVLLTGPLASPGLAAAIAALGERTGLRHVAWSPLASDAAARAWERAFGEPRPARPRLDRAAVILGLGAEFLDRPEEGFEPEFAARRVPDAEAGMSRFIQLEGRLTLTGASADERLRVRDSELAAVAAGLAHELVVGRGLGPLAGDPEVAAALAPFPLATVAERAGLDAARLGAIADELQAGAGRALVVAGGSASSTAQGPALELAALLLNETLGAFAAGLFESAAAPATGTAGALAALAAELRDGKVEALFIAGANPVYDAPAALDFATALEAVPFVLSLADRLDETSRYADYLAPASHPFECWGDATLPRGLFAVQQPVVQPLHDTRGLLDLLVGWGAALGDPAASAAVAAAAAALATPPEPAAAMPAPSPSPAYHYLRAEWAARFALDPASAAFRTAWEETLREGAWQGPAPAPLPGTFAPGAAALLAGLPPPATGLELQLYPHLALGDGRSANNGWLQEFPDPITRISWGGALSLAPRRFDEMGLANGDLLLVDAGHAQVVAPAYRHAGMHYDQVALPLGLGRTACGVIGNGTGPDAWPLRQLAGDQIVAAGLPVTIRRAGGHEALAFAQGSDVIDRDRRPIVPFTTRSAWESDPRAGTEQQEGGPSAWPAHDYPAERWAMAIDLSRCNGCGKCVLGCQAENNVPVVGRLGIIEGREMSWMRIDRYYDAPRRDGRWGAEVWDGPLAVVEEPQTLFEPMLCQHCANAPCETVCPFIATTHSADGLNQQIYNRCVGTRYCANNCPFKVRRFNFWEYSTARESALFRWLEPRLSRHADLNARAPMQMKNNPEVTVRSRGVMEKCSFCIQRIMAARAAATRAGRSGQRLPDGAVVPACLEACPTGAIVFGDLNDPGSAVARLAAQPRAMRLLAAIGVEPSISYLTKVRNDKA